MGLTRRWLRALPWMVVPLLVSLGGILGVLWERHRSEAEAGEERSLGALGQAHRNLLDHQGERLQLIASYLAQRDDLQQLLQEAAAAPALESWLEAVRGEQEVERIALLAPDGSTLAALGGGSESLSERGRQSSLSGESTVEIRGDSGGLAVTVAIPVVQRFDLLAVIVLAAVIERDDLRQALAGRGGELVDLVAGADGWSVVASSLEVAPSILEEALPPLPQQSPEGRPIAVELSLPDQTYRGRVDFLTLEGSTRAGLLSLVPAGAPAWDDPGLRKVAQWSLLGLALAVLAAMLQAALRARQVRAIEDAVERMRAGERITVDGVGSDLSSLAAAVSSWAGELEGREQLRDIVEGTAKGLEPEGGPTKSPRPPGAGIWLALEDRGSEGVNGEAPDANSDGIGVVAAAGGEIVGRLGSRLLARFEGPDGVYRAIVAAGEVERQHGPGGLAGAVTLSEGPSADPVEGAGSWAETESLLREAGGGELLLSPAARAAVSGPLGRAGMACRERLGRLQPVPVHQLDFETARRLGRGLTASWEWRPETTESRRAQPGDWVAGRYQLLSPVDSSLQTTDFRAWDRERSRPVVVKVVKRGVWEVPMERERLQTSLERCRRLRHRGLVRILDLVIDDRELVVVTEEITGPSLRRVIDHQRALGVLPGLELARELSDVLAAVHAAGLLHLDLRPGLVLFEATARPRLDGVGLAQPRLRDRGKREDGGLLVGGADYLAPEQIDGPTPDARSDVYSLGVVLYEVFTGRRPFGADSPAKVLGQHLQSEPPPPSAFEPRLPESCERLLLRCLAKDPEDRFRHAGEVHRRLLEIGSVPTGRK